MTPTSTTSASTTPDEHGDEHPDWYLVDEFRVNNVCVRVLASSNTDDVEIVLADRPERLDDPTAFRTFSPWDLRKALAAADQMLSMTDSCSLSEERIANSEFVRLEIADLHGISKTTFQASPVEQPRPLSRDSSETKVHFQFRLNGYYGWVRGDSLPDRGHLSIIAGHSEWDLETSRAMQIWNLPKFLEFLHAGSILMEMVYQQGTADHAGMRELLRLGAKVTT